MKNSAKVLLTFIVTLAVCVTASAETATQKWASSFTPGYRAESSKGVAIDRAGDVFFLATKLISPGTAEFPDPQQFYLVKYAGTDGHVLWEQTFSGSQPDYAIAEAIAVDAAGNVAITGSVKGLSGGEVDRDYYTIKYAGSNGALLWERRYGGPSNSLDTPEDVAMNRGGDVIVTGGSINTGTSEDIFTICYASSDGHTKWERRAGSTGADRGWAVIVDRAGSVLVTGERASLGSGVYLGKYDGGDGHVVWENNANGGQRGRKIAVDSAGNVAVAGVVPGPGSSDLYAAKFNGTTGKVIWERSYDGELRFDTGDAVAADAMGNVFVTGQAETASSSGDFYTAKYAAADGHVLWEKRYNGAANRRDAPRGMTLDRRGNPVVMGDVTLADFNTELYTACYSSGDGSLLWDQHYVGESSFQTTSPIALAPDGGIVIAGTLVTIKYVIEGATGGAVNGVLGPTTFSVNHSSNPGTNSTAAKSRTTTNQSASAATEEELSAFLEFLAVQLSQVPGIQMQVQYSTFPERSDSWFALQNGNQGRLARDPATGLFVAKSSDFPRLGSVYFRALTSAPGYEPKLSNVVGPFDLRLKPVALDPTVLRIDGDDRPSAVLSGQPLHFVAWQPSQASGLYVRIQSTTTPLGESSWTDLPNGTLIKGTNGGYGVYSNDYPSGSGLYFRAISAAPGKIDSISNYIGPWNLIRNDLPVVQINLAENQSFSRNSEVPISVTATHPNGISRVELYVDGELYGLKSTAPYTFDLRGTEPGTHSLIALAYDKLFTPAFSTPIERITLTDARFTIYNRVADGAWNDPSGWSPQSVPGANDPVEIGSGRNVTISGTVNVRFLHLNGNLSGPGTLNVGGQLAWISGRLDSLTLNIGKEARFLSFSDAEKTLKNVTINNAGSFVVAGRGVSGDKATIFNNDGTFTFAGQLGSLAGGTVPLATFGTVNLNGGLLRLAGGRFVAPSFTQNAGELNLGTKLIGNDGNTLIGNDGNSLIGNDGNSLIGNDGNSLIGLDGNSLIGNDGNSLIGNDGNSLVGNDGNSLAALNGAGFISEHGGALISDNGAAFNKTGGTITGFGRIDYPNFNHTGGYFRPGNSPGAIDITGNYTQGAGASLILEIGGTNGLAGNHDVVAIKGTATFAGNLIVHSLNGYQSQGFGSVPLTYGASAGQFNNVTSNAQVTLGSKGALVTVNGPDTPSPRALNISTRLPIQSGDNALFAGFIVTGPAGSTKKVMIRGIGPSLAQFGIVGAISDPFLELHTSSATITNDSWQQAPNANEIPNGFAPSDSRESIIIATLAPGNYSAILKGAHGETGVGLAEVYDLEPNSSAQLANIATRGLVQTGDNVLIGGFIIAGKEPAKVLVRAIGPSLSTFGVQGALQDTTLELHDSNGGVISNDNWRETDEAAITATTIPPSHDNEAAVLATLVPGNYTAVVRGANDTTGIAVVEAYNLQ